MTLRVTQRSIYTTSLANLQNNLGRVQETQEQLSSGRILQLPSDSPSGTGTALRHRQTIRRNEQLTRNADDGLGWLQTADSSLSEGSRIINRVRELLVQGNNSTIGDQGRSAIAEEIDGLRESLLSTANARYLDRPIFSGTADVADVYDDTGTYLGDGGEVSRSVRPGVAVAVNIPGERVFGPPGADIFAALADMSDHLRNDPTQLENDLATLDGHMDRMHNVLSEIGSRYNQVENLRTKSEEDLVLAKNQLSETENVDIVQASIDLQLRETAYQTALAATARALQPSLLDFLR